MQLDTINSEKLKEIIRQYKANFERINGEEIYKWKAVKQFQDNWNIDAADIATMIKISFGKALNMLSSVNYFPVKMLEAFAEKEPDTVREMFTSLYDENIGLDTRIGNFRKLSESILHKYWNADKHHYQDMHAISVYLAFKYPEKYYIYKAKVFKRFAQAMGISDTVHGSSIEKLQKYDELCDNVHDYVVKDPELCQLSRSRLGDDDYSDSAFHMLTQDVVYFGSRLEEKKNDASGLADDAWWPSPDEYNPGIDTTKWLELLRDKSVFTDDSLVVMKCMLNIGGEATCTELSLKYGRSKNYYNNGSWQLAKRVHDKTSCQLVERDNENSRYWPVLYTGKPAANNEEGAYIWRLRPELKDALKKIDLSGVEVHGKDEVHYWWLNASPKIWDFSEIAAGEEQSYTLENENGHKRRIYQHFLDAKEDDLVIGYESTPIKQIVALCTISRANDGSKLYFKKNEALLNPVDYSDFSGSTELQSMEFIKNPNGSLFSLTEDEYDYLMELIREKNPLPEKTQCEAYSREGFLSDVYMDSAVYDRLKELLLRRKNVILQGAPGTGKTFAAKRLAWSILGKKDESKVKFIQFHQSYSYEDFIIGYKPKEDGFSLQTGVFYKFCVQASNNPGIPYFFIIDEINRGNLSKIFGEVLMAMEADHRGEAVTLAYNDIAFTVPDNLYIIGMMNTADRSLALLDYALRRRFSFFTMEPAFDSAGFKEYQKTLGSPHFDKLVDTVKALNNEISRDQSLGKGCCIGHSYFCAQSSCTDEWLRSIVEYDLEPLIQEYWFDDAEKLNMWSERLYGALNA
jgi:5-methylcytosine-specific restriction protein B